MLHFLGVGLGVWCPWLLAADMNWLVLFSFLKGRKQIKLNPNWKEKVPSPNCDAVTFEINITWKLHRDQGKTYYTELRQKCNFLGVSLKSCHILFLLCIRNILRTTKMFANPVTKVFLQTVVKSNEILLPPFTLFTLILCFV